MLQLASELDFTTVVCQSGSPGMSASPQSEAKNDVSPGAGTETPPADSKREHKSKSGMTEEDRIIFAG